MIRRPSGINSFNLAQHLMRRSGKFEHVRQHHQVQALRGKRHFGQIVHHRGALRRRGTRANLRIGQPAVRHPTGCQGVHLWQADLHGVEAKDIGCQSVQTLLLPAQRIPTCIALEPTIEGYNHGLRGRMLHGGFACSGDSSI